MHSLIFLKLGWWIFKDLNLLDYVCTFLKGLSVFLKRKGHYSKKSTITPCSTNLRFKASQVEEWGISSSVSPPFDILKQ